MSSRVLISTRACCTELLSDAIRTAAATLSRWHWPRTRPHFTSRCLLRLSDDAIAALAKLFTAFERRGSWAEVLDLVLIVLLPKTDGGFRPIGPFPTVIRVWMPARIFVAKTWESATAMPEIFGGPGNEAQAAAFQTAMIAETANLDGDAFRCCVP